RGPVTAGQQRLFVLLATAPNGADGMDHMSGLKPVPARHLGRSRVASAERAAFGQQFRSGGPMDRAVDATTAEQGTIGCIDDRIDVERSDIRDDDVECCLADLSSKLRHAWSYITHLPLRARPRNRRSTARR